MSSPTLAPPVAPLPADAVEQTSTEQKSVEQTPTARQRHFERSNTENGHSTKSDHCTKNSHRSEKGERCENAPWQVVLLPVDSIVPSPYQPRQSFNALEMADLVASVRVHGVQQPVIVRTGPSSSSPGDVASPETAALRKATDSPKAYELVAGERRLRACKEAKRRFIPAIVRDDLSDAQAAELAILENVQRSNLTVIEEAMAYKRLMLQFRMKEERIAKKVGKSVATIREMLRLLQLPEAVQTLLAQKKLTASHGHSLLPLVAHERVCVLVAEKVTKDHLTALSLQANPLPNVSELRRLGLATDLDWRTKFDWKSQCGQCPHKAYITSGYGSYCLRPDEWKRKQEAAIELQKQESARILEEARRQDGNTVEAEKLTPGSYRNLAHATPPAGCCTSCPCRGEMADAIDPTRRIPLCLNPTRYNELVKAERQAHEDARRQKYAALWQDARDVLRSDVEAQNLARLVTLLALPVLRAEFCRYVDAEQWGSLARMVGSSMGVSIPWAEVLDGESEDGQLYALLREHLQTQPPEELLLLSVCLLLAYEAQHAVRFSEETPGLDFVLGRAPSQQHELEETNEEEEIEAE